MHPCTQTTLILLVLLGIAFSAQAAWETELRAGYNSNVNRSLSDEEADSYLSALLTHVLGDGQPGRLYNWNMSTTLQGGAYAQNSELDFLGASLAPALMITPEARWRLRLSPFVDARTLRDTDQSALHYGGALALEELWPQAFYSSQYYTYTSSKARVDTYDFSEHTLGAVIGRNWGRAFWSEIGYEFTTGTSFITIPASSTTLSTSTTGGYGRGYRQRYSSTYEAEVLRDDITRHTGMLTLGYAAQRCTPYLGYRYSHEKGDLGTSTTHEAFAGIRWKR